MSEEIIYNLGGDTGRLEQALSENQKVVLCGNFTGKPGRIGQDYCCNPLDTIEVIKRNYKKIMLLEGTFEHNLIRMMDRLTGTESSYRSREEFRHDFERLVVAQGGAVLMKALGLEDKFYEIITNRVQPQLDFDSYEIEKRILGKHNEKYSLSSAFKNRLGSYCNFLCSNLLDAYKTQIQGRNVVILSAYPTQKIDVPDTVTIIKNEQNYLDFIEGLGNLRNQAETKVVPDLSNIEEQIKALNQKIDALKLGGNLEEIEKIKRDIEALKNAPPVAGEVRTIMVGGHVPGVPIVRERKMRGDRFSSAVSLKKSGRT